MIRTIFVCLLLCSLSSILLQAQEAKISSGDIGFEFVHNGVKGTFGGFKSESTINWDALDQSVFKGSVESKTISTRNGLRNWSLRSSKYFDVDDYPFISFESTKVEQQGSNILATGNLTIKSTTKTVTINFSREKSQLVGLFSLYSSDYDIKIKKKREDNLVKVRMEFDLE
ncbi:YceI family protein [Flagellimonas flava]|uniref:YceI-like domain-containing protein n=1 Tax=Flagellimonas flava TaxID=570519 RepID=A0A1M5ILX0_9FLAO|nr:YceI family protein [Allomuricauda flava]SHG29236.1 YceI-like domain-containing protein [Allomuricauda flava]